jgi:hypothetical protein
MKLTARTPEPPSLFDSPLTGAPFDPVSSDNLQKRIDSSVDSSHWMRWNVKVASASVGRALYARASDITTDYSRTVKVMGKFYASPERFDSLRSEMLLMLHDFASDGDRRDIEKIMGGVDSPDEPLKMDPQGRPIKAENKGALAASKRAMAQLGSIPADEKALRAKGLIDIYNEAIVNRRKFAKKHGLTKEFGFGEDLKAAKDYQITYPSGLESSLKDHEESYKNHLYDVSIDDDGKQRMVLKPRPGLKEVFSHIFSSLTDDKAGSVEARVGLGLGRLFRHLTMGSAIAMGLTHRASEKASHAKVQDVDSIRVLRESIAAPALGKSIPKPLDQNQQLIQQLLHAQGKTPNDPDGGGGGGGGGGRKPRPQSPKQGSDGDENVPIFEPDQTEEPQGGTYHPSQEEMDAYHSSGSSEDLPGKEPSVAPPKGRSYILHD